MVDQDEEEGEGSGAGQAANSTSPSGGQQARKTSISFSLPFGAKAKK